MKSWLECAEHYLEQWWEQDRHFVQAFSGEVICETLRDFFYVYGVARTIPGKIEELGAEGKYRPFADMLNKYQHTVMSRELVPAVIDAEVKNMDLIYGQRPWSATSKAFWMMKQHPIVVFDNFAWHGLQTLGLKPGYETYREYFHSWFGFFEREETNKNLDDAITWLLSESPYAKKMVADGRMDAPQLATACESQWFRNRVTDIYLCCLGGADISEWRASLKEFCRSIPHPCDLSGR